MTLLINSFNGLPHPLREGLIALRKIFNVKNTGCAFNWLEITWAINDYLETIEPHALRGQLNAFQLSQSEKGKRPRNVRGLTPQDRERRNQEIKKHFKDVSEKSALSLNGFAQRYAKKYNLSPTGIKKIIAS